MNIDLILHETGNHDTHSESCWIIKHFFTFIIQIICNFKCNLKVFGARIAFGILTRLCRGWTSDRGVGGSIPGSGKRYFSTPKRHDRVRIPLRLCNEKWELFPHGQATEM
jgi:hypothetical protein